MGSDTVVGTSKGLAIRQYVCVGFESTVFGFGVEDCGGWIGVLGWDRDEARGRVDVALDR